MIYVMIHAGLPYLQRGLHPARRFSPPKVRSLADIVILTYTGAISSLFWRSLYSIFHNHRERQSSVIVEQVTGPTSPQQHSMFTCRLLLKCVFGSIVSFLRLTCWFPEFFSGLSVLRYQPGLYKYPPGLPR